MNTAPAPFSPYEITPESFTAEFETASGKGLIREAEHMPRVGTRRATRAASLLADPIRESYAAYWTVPEDAEDRSEALATVRRRLPHLSPEKAEHFLMLVAYAVHTEMKFRADPGYVTDPAHDFELLIDQADYDDVDDLSSRGTEENIERLVNLADTAAYYAHWDNENAALDARQANRAAA